mmetsp:Transcript_8087/g.13185  ORF Transcript_8087/g.13185 Transcript_8087/m.13185 type:complete len:211 (+) Transcript_8087:49-681(+)
MLRRLPPRRLLCMGHKLPQAAEGRGRVLRIREPEVPGDHLRPGLLLVLVLLSVGAGEFGNQAERPVRMQGLAPLPQHRGAAELGVLWVGVGACAHLDHALHCQPPVAWIFHGECPLNRMVAEKSVLAHQSQGYALRVSQLGVTRDKNPFAKSVQVNLQLRALRWWLCSWRGILLRWDFLLRPRVQRLLQRAAILPKSSHPLTTICSLCLI